MIELRPYQQEALTAIADAHERNVPRALVALPTGAGKTVVFSSLIQSRGGTALILAHRDELLQQAADKLTTVAPDLGMSVGFVKAARNDTHAPVVIASVQTLARQVRLAQLPTRFDTVVVDEAHHATAPTYRRILDRVSDSPLIVGVTATPERADKGRLADVFPELVYARGIEEMIREGYLCDVIGARIDVDLDLDNVKQSRGDFQAADLGDALEEAEASSHVLDAFLEHARDRKTIVFVPTVALAHEMAAEFRGAGVDAEAIDGQTEQSQRRAAIDRLSSGETQVICNVGVLTEGFDEPSVSCIIMAAPTKSRVRYIQAIGRGLRLHPGKENCLVLDLVGASKKLTLQSLPGLFGLDAPPKPNQSITAAIDAQARRKEGAQKAAEARRKKLVSNPIAFFDRSKIHWLEIDGRWVLSIGDSELLVLDSGDDRSWRVLLVGRRGAQVVARGLDLGYAQGAGEEIIRSRSTMALVDRTAAWRSREPSAGQLKYLARLGVDQIPGSMGEAGDLITEAIARDRLAKLDAALERRAVAS